MSDENKKPVNITQTSQVVSYQEWSSNSAIPPPQFLVEFDKILPGSAKQFIQNPLDEVQHRRSIEILAVKEQLATTKRGQYGAIFLGTLLIGLAGYCAFSDRTAIAVASITAIAAVVGVFLAREKSDSK